MRILFITATRLGDAVLSTGLLASLIARHPGARVTVACGAVAAGLFARMPGLERVIVIEKRKRDAHWFDLWRACVGTVWDLAVDLRGSLVTLALPARSRRIMRGGRRPGHRITHLAGVFRVDPPPRPVVWTDASDRAVAAEWLPDGTDWVGLGPTANWAGKVWAAENFIALFERLEAERPGLRPVVFAGPGEAEAAMAAPVLRALPGAVDLRGRLALPEVAAALARCRLFVGNDSGLMHLSAAAGAPTLGLFGPSRASEYAPVGERARYVEAPGQEGSGDLASLTVEAVLPQALSEGVWGPRPQWGPGQSPEPSTP